jgi:hypothetical protein
MRAPWAAGRADSILREKKPLWVNANCLQRARTLSLSFHAALFDYAGPDWLEIAMRQFVPMTDDMLEHSDQLPGPLVPYQCGFRCWHRLQAEPQRVQPPPPSTSVASDASAPLNV